MIAPRRRKTIVVIGNGMVGHRFCERLIDYDVAGDYRLVAFSEEPRAAYDRVGLTSFFAHRDSEQVMTARKEWYRTHGIELHTGDRAREIDRDRKVVRSDKGVEIQYDTIVMATGSYPFVPQIPGITNSGVFVYRTIDDLKHMMEYSKQAKRCAIIGGGLLGLQAAKAAHDIGLETHVIESAPRLMPRQIDDKGSQVLVAKIEALGVKVHLNMELKEVLGNRRVEGLKLGDDSQMPFDMLVVSAGVRPRDDLAKNSGLELGARGGIAVDDHLRTSDPNIFAIGECALHAGMVYGLVAPGFEMADIVAANLCGRPCTFSGADLSTNLKPMGVDVANFGDYEADETAAKALVFEDPFEGIYKKLLVSLDGKKLLGGMLVGNSGDYGRLQMICKSDTPLNVSPAELLFGSSDQVAWSRVSKPEDFAQSCSCSDLTHEKERLSSDSAFNAVIDFPVNSSEVAGCDRCLPFPSNQLSAVNNPLCEHFAFTRHELHDIVKIMGYRTFAELADGHGTGEGCEVCKSIVASIFASLWDENILDRAVPQDSIDLYLTTPQRGGTFSVVPRIEGGEVSPEKLIVLGEVGRKYNLYAKITGDQRIDLFGAQLHQLPDIWEELIAAGFENGHAFGKALRTVKSCVGSTWCRHGMHDSVAFAVRLENRYKGLRAPHKIKAAVSGCVRECADVQFKDFGLMATEKGYNLYVCGNGGPKPRRGYLFVSDIDEETALRYVDRFLMYYVHTAERRTRTSVWLEKMEGGIEHLREVIIHDKLGICEDLERQMQFLADTYKCEWAEIVNDVERRRLFRQFVNTDESDSTIEVVSEQGQQHTA